MGRPGSYLELDRVGHGTRSAEEAVRDFDEIARPLPLARQEEQASRCMYCGVAFCQSGIAFAGARKVTGCPLHNLIPETNDLLYRGRLEDAAQRLSLTNPFPEFTGRVCPHPCETACNLGLHDEAVTIRDDERAISDAAWERGMSPLPTPAADAPLVTVVGSGPAGLAAAWELCRLGRRVRVVERDDRAGGLLMYGIPNMKLPKDVVARRVRLMEESGIGFSLGTDAAQEADAITAASTAVVIATGARQARGLSVPGSDLPGVTPALAYLEDATRALLEGRGPGMDAKGRDVVVIGGGDTGVDCLATALRQGARSVTQVIRAAAPPRAVDVLGVWPGPRGVYETEYGQLEAEVLEGRDPRLWSCDTLGFVADDAGALSGVRVCDISYEGGRHDVEGTERVLPAQLVLVAKGFTGPERGLLDAFGVQVASEGRPLPLTANGTHRAIAEVETPVYLAGDVRTGSSIVASAISDALACVSELAAAR